MKTVTMTIHNGEVKIEASGFKGTACDAATKIFEDALGGPVTNKKRKNELFQKEAGEFLTTGAK